MWIADNSNYVNRRDEVVHLLQAANPIEFSGDLVRVLTGPIVYVIFRSDQPLYVGMSRHGVGRFTRQHPAMTRVEDSDRLHCYPMADTDSARKLEALLIAQLRPAWNTQGLRDYRAAGEQLGMTPGSARRLARISTAPHPPKLAQTGPPAGGPRNKKPSRESRGTRQPSAPEVQP